MHLEVIRYDKTLQQLFGWKNMPSYKSYQRYFNKFTQAINQRVFQSLYEWFFSHLYFDNFTLDFDSSVLTRYGYQEGSKKGYNPTKRGRNSHHPIIAFISDCRMIANLWLRPSNTADNANFEAFILDTLQKLKNKTVGLIRMDSGFFSNDIMKMLEGKLLNFIIAVRMYPTIQRTIAEQKVWLNITKGIDMCEFTFQAETWEKPRRIVAVRQRLKDRPRATGKQLYLYKEDFIISQYRYSSYVTNMNLSMKVIWDSYKGRADSENRIKELKEDFGFSSFSTQNFFALEATLNFIMLAYNLMSLFKQVIINDKKQPQLKTLRYKLFAKSAYITKKGNIKTLNIAISIKDRKWWNGLFDKVDEFKFT